jgi:hypothetical protein
VASAAKARSRSSNSSLANVGGLRYGLKAFGVRRAKNLMRVSGNAVCSFRQRAQGKIMKDRHVRSILESAPFEHLSAGESEIVRAHAASCVECARALEAARLASSLVRERAASQFEPSPFFQTRVLAALRARRAADEVPALLRLWRAAGALASSMVAAVVLLAAFTFVQPSTGADELAASSSDPYSTEAVLAQDETTDNDVDVLTVIYDSDENTGGFDGQEH